MSIASEVKQSNATSYTDMKAQETKQIGLPPLRKEMEKSPLERAQTKDREFFAINSSAALQLDANVAAKQLVGLEGLPE